MEYASTENLSTIGKGGKCKYGKRKYRIAWVENASTETGRAILTQTWQKNTTRQGSYWIPTHYHTLWYWWVVRQRSSSPSLVTVLQPSYHPVCSSYQALSRSYLLQGLPILEHRQPAHWSLSRLGSDSLWSPTASLRVVTVDQVFTLHGREPTESLRRILDTETQSTGNAAGASVAFADRKFYE